MSRYQKIRLIRKAKNRTLKELEASQPLKTEKGLSQEEFEAIVKGTGYSVPEISDEVLTELPRPDEHNSYTANMDPDEIKHEIERLLKVIKWT